MISRNAPLHNPSSAKHALLANTGHRKGFVICITLLQKTTDFINNNNLTVPQQLIEYFVLITAGLVFKSFSIFSGIKN